MDRTSRRDPKNLDHKMSAADAVALAPRLDLRYYFAEVGSPSFTEMELQGWRRHGQRERLQSVVNR